MFELDADLDHVPMSIDSVIELYSSVNQPPIAAAGLDPQEARAYFVSMHGPEGIEAFIYLHMLLAGCALVYRWEGPIAKSDYPEVQAEGLSFTESMGFMMENLQVRRMGGPEREALGAQMLIFTPLASGQPAVENLEVLDASLPPDESILDLALDASTQVGYEPSTRPSSDEGPAEDPLQDKNFKVFLRLLTSV